MAETRKSRKLSSSPSPSPKTPPNPSKKLRKTLETLSSGGCGGRKYSGHARRRSYEEVDHTKWNMCQPITCEHQPQSQPIRTPEIDVPSGRPFDAPNIILQKDNLRKHITQNLTCKTCAITHQQESNKDFLQFLEAELDLSTCQSTSLWKKYVRRNSAKGKSVFHCEDIAVEYENKGFAGEMFTRCSRRSKRFQGHRARCGAEVLNSIETGDKSEVGYNNTKYSLNQRIILAMNLLGTSFYDCEKLCKLVGLPCYNFRTYKKIEELIGEYGLTVVSMKARKEALQEEIKLTKESYTTTKYGTLPALVVSVDMA